MNTPTDTIINLTFELLRTVRKQFLQKPHMHATDCPSMLQMQVLHMIMEHEGLTMKEVAAFMKVSSPSATSFITRLVNLGLLERVADSKNRKFVRLKITKKGKTQLALKTDMRNKALTNLLSTLTKKDQEDFTRILHALVRTVQKKNII